MKTLLLMRHAKSSWKEAAIPDHERPLNGRGRQAAPKMGRLIQSRQLVPDVILCSTAVRARQTCELLFQELPVEPQFLPDLYHCPANGLLDLLRALPDSADRVLLIGHNPGLADFLAAFAGFDEKFSTAALAELALDRPTWCEFTPQTSLKLINLWRPRELD